MFLFSLIFFFSNSTDCIQQVCAKTISIIHWSQNTSQRSDMDAMPTSGQLSECLTKTGSATDQGSPRSSAQHLDQPNLILRRRCRSECLQMSTIVHTNGINEQNGYDYEHLNEICCKPANADFRNTSGQHGLQRSVYLSNGDSANSPNSKRIYSHIDSAQSGNLQHKENIKENISMDESDIKITDYNDFRYETPQLYGEKVKKPNFLYNLNEENDKEYFDIISIVSNDFTEPDIKLVGKKLRDESRINCNNLNGYSVESKSQRRTRARSESEQNECYQVPKQHVLHNQDNSDVS